MSNESIPHFPVVHGNIYPDGTAHINFAGHDVPLHPANIDDAREQITSYAIAVARDVLHRPVRLTTVDPAGSWTLAAHPDGRITDLAAPSRVTKRPKRRRGATSATPPTPGTDNQADALAPSAGRTEPARPAPTTAGVTSVTVPSSAPLPPTADAITRIADVPAWTPSDLPTEAEMTVFVARHQPAAPAAPVLSLDFGQGVAIAITGAALVGRRPVNSTGSPLELHQVTDDTRNLSRTHFVIAWHEDVPAIIDQHSQNGTFIERGLDEIPCTPGVAMPLRDGDTLRFGDLACRVSITTDHTSGAHS